MAGIRITLLETGQESVARLWVNKPEPKEEKEPDYLIHFRRPQNYEGEFGFDWMRDEYIEIIDSNVPVCKTPEILEKQYKIRNFHNQKYYVPWLALLPFSTEYKYGSSINKDGANLNLELQELTDLKDDGTKIVFKIDGKYNDAVKITPASIELSEFLNQKTEVRNISNEDISYRVLKNKVNIKCLGVLEENVSIKVIATKNGKEQQVGELMLFKTSKIPKAKIILVKVITNDKPFSLPNDFEYALKYKSFNQALTRVEVIARNQVLDLRNRKEKTVVDFLYDLKMNRLEKKEVLENIIDFYEAFNGKTSSNYIYLFYHNNEVSEINRGRGIKSKGFTNRNRIILNLGGLNTHTIIHEIGHALGLKHPFEEYENIPLFEKGTTDNYMDYEHTGYSTGNPHKGKMFSLFKWQWDEIHKNKNNILKFDYDDNYKSFWDIF
ncbi:hypothetical protein [Capnocytophaga catalasegens]|uniref:Uncharacterized protein n=1 Tax=Capnocytophaga catalasegens TaxID=1004260 RepID=A0AAV5B1C5_9FLAO|nr:hypothetical protein [Capnocytophaga catalasegens]GIZ16389.1 hypothetical protein RCZ03_23890 [Capnocytophaga catalasegens]GJM51592.1 hypothetical protein RCZ15_25650 [Capnocytophaga catalasegens]GJM54327.1 hypothetical protein RCZ16_26430 [Capnocytophaga catalasegens]